MMHNQSSIADPELHPVLTERSIAYLSERGVPHDIAVAARLSSLSSHQIDYLLSREKHISSGGLGIPYHTYPGQPEISWRVRLDEVPDQKKSGRWRWTRDEPVRPYLPPMIPADVWQDTTVPIVVVEGPIKALAVWAAGHVCIGLAGVDTGHDAKLSQEYRTVRLHPELLARVVWRGRRVIVVFDCNRETNPMVAWGEARFCTALRHAGADVVVGSIPEMPAGKEGPDDLLVFRGGEAFAEVLAGAVVADPVQRVREAFAGVPKDAVRAVYRWLEGLPFQAALAFGGSVVADECAFEAGRHMTRRVFAETVSKFRARLAGKKLADETDDEPVEKQLDKLNDKHAIVKHGSNTLILWEETRETGTGKPRKSVEFTTEASMELYYKNRTILVDDGRRRRETNLFKYWLKHPLRRTFEGVALAPEGCPADMYNLWQGWPVTPCKGDWSLLRTHIWENICCRDEASFKFLIAWMADGIQNPHRKPGTAIVLRGKEGTGKGVLASAYGALFGAHYLQVSSPKHFLGNFNAHLANCIFLFADEAFWAGDKSMDGTLKTLITEQNHNIERKGKDVVQMRSLIRMIMASNSDWVVPAGPEARRFCVLDVADTKMQNGAYFEAIRAQLADGGIEAFMYDLAHTDLSIADVRTPPQTRALLDQKLASLGSVQKFWYGRLKEGSVDYTGNWRESISCYDLYQHYLKESQQVRERYSARPEEFGVQLRKLLPQHDRRRKTLESRDMEGNLIRRQAWHYILPSLAQCRTWFAKEIVHCEVDWEEEGEVVSPNVDRPN